MLASVVAILIGAVIAAVLGFNPLAAYGALVTGAFGTSMALSSTLAGAVPLALAGLGVAVAFRAGLFNIGAEGQYWIGVIVAVWLGYHLTGLPGWLHTLVCVVGATLAGGLWGGVIPGLAKAYRGAHEVITTMMMSYIAIYFGQYLIAAGGPMHAPGYNAQSPQIVKDAWLTVLLPPQLTTAVFFAIGAALVVWWGTFHTTVGFRLRAVGANPHAARYAGISVPVYTVLALGLSGMLAGLAGGVQVLALDHRLMWGFNTGYGYTAIVVALMARNHPFGVLLAALFFSALSTGGQNMQMVSQLPSSLTDVLTGLIVFFVAAERIVPLTIAWYRRRRGARAQVASAREGGR
ncbi:ABC transporter permease [Alicyclobacillus sp.]|uniref:ABC transporter permease n=1 Tax=Alicyclobacillus sp. TaxID=61169 RepID=UPI0025BA553F|nr:ABC transporter permease [Alicyclobacillus sp.]